MGYEVNPYDRCVYNRKEGDGTQSTLCIHVDDMMLTTVSESHLDGLLEELKVKFGDITINRGRVQDYLGMTFDFTNDRHLRVSMRSFIDNVLEPFALKESVSTPANNNLFHTNSEPQLPKEDAETFHKVTAQLLYLAKRTRPDILFAVSFLVTRVKEPTQGDYAKLMRVLKYLHGTRDLDLLLQHSGCIMYYWLFYVPAIYLYCTAHTPTTLFLY